MPPRWKIIAVVAGILLAGVPMAAFNLWIDALADRQGQDEVDLWASRSIGIAESRIQDVVTTLDSLAARGVVACDAPGLTALRQATFSTTPIKELSVVGTDGQVLCSDAGLAVGPRAMIASQPLFKSGNLFLEVMHGGERPGRLVQIRRQNPGAVGVAALVPSELFMARVSTQGAILPVLTRTTLLDGTVIGECRTSLGTQGAAGPFVTGIRTSERFGLFATVSVPRAVLNDGSLRMLGAAVTAVIALIVAAFAALLPRQRKGNPVDDLEKALEAGEFVPFYQPIIDITSGRLRGAEVLIRWRKRDGTLVLPASFIPLAESSGLVMEMTRNLMRVVRDELEDAYANRPQLRVEFNLAASHFADDRVVRDIRNIFGRSTIRYSQIVLELTERQPVDSLSATRSVIASIQELGMKVAIDDVGAGHAGLSYMLKLGVDVIKIDKVFIDSIGSDSGSMRIIETLVDLANNMRMEIIAEGVENFEQVVALRKYGVRSAQGYLFAPPLSGPSFLRLVEAIEPVAARKGGLSEAA